MLYINGSLGPIGDHLKLPYIERLPALSFFLLFFPVIHTQNLHEASHELHAMLSVQRIWQAGS